MSSCSTPACPPTNVKFQLRRATSSEWTARNPQLRAGEPGVETDTGQLKIGNETCDRWNDLPYVGSSSSTDLEAIRNLALNAFIWDAAVTATYSAANLSINTNTTFYGNSSYYDITYTLSPSTIATTTGYFVNNSNKIFNNLAPNAAPNSTVGNNVFQKTIPITNLVTGANTLTLNITTQNAGGTGRYSTKQIQTTINLTANDPMGNPTIAITTPSTTLSNIQTLRISGLYYYTNGTIINFPAASLTFNNIYNIIQFSSLPANFLTVTDSSGSSTTIQNTSILYYGANLPFPAPSQTNTQYLNNAISYTLNGSGYTAADRLTLTATNPKNLSGTQFYGGPEGKTYIGYIGTGWNASFERTISLKTSTNSGISAIERMSNKTPFTTPATSPLTPTTAQIVTFNPEAMGVYDCYYLPYMDTFVSDINISNSFANIQLPYDVPTVPGIRILTLQLTNTAVLQTFTLLIGTASRAAVTVHNISVKWSESTTPAKTYGWYDASIPYTDAGGCQKGVSGNWYTNQININRSDMTTYSLSNGAIGGNIWIIVQYSGSIYKNDINII